ncbi:MAG: polyprenyl synthetase family protein [Candidatus Alcyoniella australis]|nr:polyprenyl synthetase family protein [Candidatus Alcyoniella australis]
MSLDLAGYLELQRDRVDAFLKEYLRTLEAPSQLVEGMRYALLGPGKRIRPILASAAARCVGEKQDQVLPAACALEMIHAYSLVHDDLPAMDDDELRRGRPSTHVAFGEAQAVLIGDALLSEAFVLLGDLSRHPGIYAHELLEVSGRVARAAGAWGMVGGQWLDIVSQGAAPDIADVERIHLGKTARLIQVACYLGARLGGGAEAEVQSLSNYGLKLGLLFQLQDDVLAEVGSEQQTGKRQGRDRELHKATAVAALGLDSVRLRAKQLAHEALGCLSNLDEQRYDPLLKLVRYVLDRAD